MLFSIQIFYVRVGTSIDRYIIKPLNAKLNPICHLLTLLGAHHIFYVSRISVKVAHWGRGI
jgi:hypothetical protein